MLHLFTSVPHGARKRAQRWPNGPKFPEVRLSPRAAQLHVLAPMRWRCSASTYSCSRPSMAAHHPRRSYCSHSIHASPFVSACADGLHCIAVARVPRAQEKRPTRASEGIQLLLLLLVAINVHLLTSARYSGCLGTMAAALGEERWRPGEPCGLARSLGRSLRLSTSSSFIARAGACLQRLRSSSAGGGRFLSAAAVVAVLPTALVGLPSRRWCQR